MKIRATADGIKHCIHAPDHLCVVAHRTIGVDVAVRVACENLTILVLVQFVAEILESLAVFHVFASAYSVVESER